MIDKRLFQEVKNNKVYMSMMVANGLLTFATSFFIAFFTAKIVNTVFLEKKPFYSLTTEFICLLCFILLRFTYQLFFEAKFRKTALAIKHKIRTSIFNSILKLGPLDSFSGKIGSNTSNVGEAADYFDSYFYEFVPHFFSMVISIPLILIPVFILDKLSFVIMLITAPLLPIFLSLIGMASKSFNEARMKSLKQLSSVFIDTLNGIKTLKLFGMSKAQAQKIFDSSEGFRKTTMEVLRVSFLSAFVLELAATISTAIIAVSLGLRLMYGQMEFFPAFLILLLAPEFYQPIRQFGAKFHTSLNAKAAADGIYPIINAANEVNPSVKQEKSSAENINNKNSSSDQQITKIYHPSHTEEITSDAIIKLENISFQYEKSNTFALKSINLDINSNTTNAIIGKSGSGKSTLSYILLGLIKPTSGIISSKDIVIAYVPQKPFIFKGSLRENIIMDNTLTSTLEINQVIKAASLEDFTSALPFGLETELHSEGINVSVGEAQRIAIARALVRKASLIIIDEATSAQDEENQEVLMNTIRGLKSLMTVVVIAHRLETITGFDNIIEMSEGRIQI